jgi:hypothetical protein
MDWLKIRLNCFQISLPAESEATLRNELHDFWVLFCRDVLPANVGKPWDHFAITMRGVDGNAGVYPDLVGLEPQQVAWSSVHIGWWQMLVDDIPDSDDPSDLTYSNSVRKLDEWIASLVVRSAQQAGLARLAGRAESGIRLRFHRYDNRDPFMDVVVH